MRKVFLAISMMVLATLSLSANEEQFYFVAKPADEGVYLRWDVVEGNYPSSDEIDYMILRKNDQNISTFRPDGIMSVSQIRALYALPANQADLMSVIDMISKNDDPACSGANLSNYAEKIQGCMEDPMWRYMAMKAHFPLAVIGERAYLDRNPGTDPVTYELIAVKQNGASTLSKRLGKVVVDPTQRPMVLAAKNFKQVRQSSACNAPEYAKDDYTVSLTWENGGSQTDSFANSMLVTGYDIYRAKEGDQPLLQTEIADLVQNAQVDSNGNYVIPGLEKVNDVPVQLSNSEEEETPLFLETKDELEKAGLKPGDSRWYYLVPRDFSGHYGKMAHYKVTIPDLLPPVTPWGVHVIEHEGKAKLVWNNITAANYAKYYKRSRKFCNLNTLSSLKRLRFADKDGDCGVADVSVNLNVKKYYIYRFDNPADAAKFKDSDMDGIPDLEESPDDVCIANQITSANQYLARHLVAVLNASDFEGKEFVTFIDKLAKSKYYWYRIASATETTPSILTPPIRAMIPDRTLPGKPEPELSTCSNYIVSAYSIEGETPYIAYDETGEAKEVKLTCMTNATYALVSHDIYLPVGDDGYVKSNGINLCQCASGTISFLDEHRKVLAQKTLCSGCSRATEFYVLQENDCRKFGGFKVVHHGEDIPYWPIADLSEPIAEDECVEFTVYIGGKRIKAVRNCKEKNHFDLSDLNLSNLGEGEKYCIGMTVYNANNQHSPTSYLPCFGVIDQHVPNKPSIRRLIPNDNNVSVAWLSPQEKIAATIVKLYAQDDEKKVYLRTFAHPDHMEKAQKDGITMNVDILLDTPATVGETWCAKAKSVGFNGKLSQWSEERCMQKGAQNVNTEALPWPKIPSVKKSGNFNFVVNNSILKTVLSEQNISVPGGDDGMTNKIILEREVEKKFRQNAFSFVLYRQMRENGIWSNFVQVSPLISDENVKIVKVLFSKSVGDNMNAVFWELENGLYLSGVFTIYKNGGFSGTASLFYIDHYPYKNNRAYRYVKVNMDQDHEIVDYEISNRVIVGTEETTQPPATGINVIPQLNTGAQLQQLPQLNTLQLNTLQPIGGVQ